MKPFHAYFQLAVQDAGDVQGDRLCMAAEWVMARHRTSEGAELSIVISDDVEVQMLNRQFRGIDAPTDVLSFPADPEPVPEDIDLDADEGGDYLGDLVLSLPYIQRQAAAEQHAVSDELLLAVIHGTLHLLGYDHDTSEHQDIMWEAQAEALQEFGVNITVPRFEFPDAGDGE